RPEFALASHGIYPLVEQNRTNTNVLLYRVIYPV
ncbi:unnamed protein product, partial [marine sediment metagenome]